MRTQFLFPFLLISLTGCHAKSNGVLLTYHRWARKDQVLRAYPKFPEFLRRKLRFDPEERFQSDWYRHYKEMFAEELKAGL